MSIGMGGQALIWIFWIHIEKQSNWQKLHFLHFFFTNCNNFFMFIYLLPTKINFSSLSRYYRQRFKRNRKKKCSFHPDPALQRQNTEISKQIFPEKEYRVSVPISTFMRLWAIYIFPRSVSLYCWRKYVDRSWDYINRSQTHECWNWGWGRAIPRKGYIKEIFFAVRNQK